MISFYKDEVGVVMYKDDTYRETMLFVIERPATDEDIVAHADEHAAFVASITPAAPAPVEPALMVTEPAAAPEGTM
jgi:hypothetical protein